MGKEYIINIPETLINMQHPSQGRRETGHLSATFWNEQCEIIMIQEYLILYALKEVKEKDERQKFDLALKAWFERRADRD